MTVEWAATTAMLSGSSILVQRCGGSPARADLGRDDSVSITLSRPWMHPIAGLPSRGASAVPTRRWFAASCGISRPIGQGRVPAGGMAGLGAGRKNDDEKQGRRWRMKEEVRSWRMEYEHGRR